VRVFCLFLLGLCLSVQSLFSDSFTEDIKALTASSHRLSGTQEGRAAADYIKGRLKSIGVETVITQPFVSPQTVTQHCELKSADGTSTHTLIPMRPCGILPPVTPEEGITGPLLRNPHLSANITTTAYHGAIVVLDFNGGNEWINALRHGARAIVFIRNGLSRSHHKHFAEINVNIPRFFYDGAVEDLPLGKTVTIKSEVVWEPMQSRNVIAFIPGHNPVFDFEKEEYLLVAANFDSFGEVPELSPGARGAANCAALLRLAERFVKHPPRRHLVLAFFDNQARLHQGSSRFFRALDVDTRIQKEASVEGRQASYDEEIAYINEMEALLAHPSPLQVHDSSVRHQLLSDLRAKAGEYTFTLSDSIHKLREEAYTIAKVNMGDEVSKKRSEEIQNIIERELEPLKSLWTKLRRALGKDETLDLPPDVSRLLDRVLADSRDKVHLRRSELLLEKESLEADQSLRHLLAKKWCALHASLMLGDSTSMWSVLVGGDSSMKSSFDKQGLYGKILSSFHRAYLKATENGMDLPNFLVDSVDQSLSQSRSLWGADRLVHSGEVAGLFGIYNVVLGTVHERLEREGTPDDTLAHLQVDKIQQQSDEIASLLSSVAALEALAPEVSPNVVADAKPLEGVADQAGLSIRRAVMEKKVYQPRWFESKRVYGPRVLGSLEGSSVANTPIPGATVMVRYQASKALTLSRNHMPGFDNCEIKWTDGNGSYELGPAPFPIERARGFSARFSPRGELTMVSDAKSAKQAWIRMNLFKADDGFTVLPLQQNTSQKASSQIKLLSSQSNSVLDETKSNLETGDGVVVWYVDEREDGVKLFNLKHLVALNSGSANQHKRAEKSDGTGEGFSIEAEVFSQNITGQSASDLWRLNDARIAILRSKGILDSSLAELHGRVEALLVAAEKETSPERKTALEMSAYWSNLPVYDLVRSILNDTVFAVLILLALSVPFAFALERVVVGATTIYQQLSWFSAFFTLTFLLLYFTHPAFAIANTPLIIFLGFTIVVMSVLVIALIMRRFESELKALQGITAGVHSADVSRAATFMAAMQMGVSTLRHRPLRTSLTAATVILLTFTILCFASFSTESGIIKFFVASRPDYDAVLIRDLNWKVLSQDMAEVIEGRWGERVNIEQRSWVTRQTPEDAGMTLVRRDGSKPIIINGLLGLSQAELQARKDLLEHFGPIAHDEIAIPDTIARSGGFSVGDQVMVKGFPLTIKKIFDSVRASTLNDMDGSSVFPVDFGAEASTTSGEENPDQGKGDTLEQEKSWTALRSDAVVVVSQETAKQLGGELYAIHVYCDHEEQAISIGEDAARMLPFPILATCVDGVYRHVLGTILAASGVQDLFFPILLGGLVIFGTMLGSVADREREIYTFSALGLAPRHVATLFLAEAMIYSLLGGLGGYFIAQGSVAVLSHLADYGWVRVPDMNMTSTNTVITILIVMLTVLLSALYPAIKASKSANPGLMRTWSPPRPKDNLIDLIFPFTVSEYDITGVVSFLKEHFDDHGDTGMGQFMSEGSMITQDAETGMLGFKAKVALAPFDLGVGQTMLLNSANSGIEGIDEIRLQLLRHSGQPKDWERLNKRFLQDLRRQFLLWRSLPIETMEHYRSITLSHLREVKASKADANSSPQNL